jgi:hypothetical protein
MPDVFCRSFNGIGISFAFCRRSAPRRVIVVFPHTFGRHLNFNCYLHMLVSEGGLEKTVFRENSSPSSRRNTSGGGLSTSSGFSPKPTS